MDIDHPLSYGTFSHSEGSRHDRDTDTANTLTIWTDGTDLCVQAQDASGTVVKNETLDVLALPDPPDDPSETLHISIWGHPTVSNTIQLAWTELTTDMNGNPVPIDHALFAPLPSGNMEATVHGGDAADVILGSTATMNRYSETLRGGDGPDTVQGRAGDDWVYGEAGDDPVLNGGDGDDHIYGGDGDDTIDGGDGNDTIWGDDLVGPGGQDSIRGRGGVDEIHGGPMSDWIRGGPGEGQTLFGDGGNDVIEGGNDGDIIDGGDGDDVILGDKGVDHLDGGDGRDRIHSGRGAPVDSNDPTNLGDPDVLFGGDGNDLLCGEVAAWGVAQPKEFYGETGVDCIDPGDDASIMVVNCGTGSPEVVVDRGSVGGAISCDSTESPPSPSEPAAWCDTTVWPTWPIP